MSQTMPTTSEPTPPTPGAEQRTAWASAGYVPYNPDVVQPNSPPTGATQKTEWQSARSTGNLSSTPVGQLSQNVGETEWQSGPAFPNLNIQPSGPDKTNTNLPETQWVSGEVFPGLSQRLGGGVVENTISAVKNSADFVVNGVEKFVNPSGQSESLADMAAKGVNASPWEQDQLKAAGYSLVDKKAQVYAGTQKVQDKYVSTNWGLTGHQTYKEVPVYNEAIVGKEWVKNDDGIMGLIATPFEAAYNFGYEVGQDIVKPGLEYAGLYDPTKEAVYDLYNASPLKYEPVDMTNDTLRIAQREGIPVSYSGGKFVINASGADYDKYSAKLEEIQRGLQSKQKASIFGTGLTWDQGINYFAASILPKSWSPKSEVLEYENSGQPGSLILKGLTDAYGKWYNDKVAKAPVNVLTEIGGEAAYYVASGAVIGTAIKGGTIALRLGAEGASGLLGEGAGAIGEGITGKILNVGSKALTLGSEVEEGSIAGRALNAVVNVSGKAAAGVDTAVDLLNVGAKGLNEGSRYIEPAINVGMTYQLGLDVASSKSYEEGFEKVPGLVAGVIGYKAGSEGAIKAYDMMRTRGTSEIPIAEIVDAKVLSGENKFPMIEKGSTPTDVINAFKTSEGTSKGYHATPAEFKSIDITRDATNPNHPSDMPGLYVSPEDSGPSIHFTRIGNDSGNPYTNFAKGLKETTMGVQKTVTGLKKAGTEYLNEKSIGENQTGISAGIKTAESGMKNIKSGVGQMTTSIVGGSTPMKPAILHVELAKDVERLPENARYDYGKAAEVYRENAGSGRTFLTPVLEKSLRGGGGPEAEAVITPETKLTKIGSEGYINFNGRRIPIMDYKAEAAGGNEVPKNLNFSESVKAGRSEVNNMETEAGKLKNNYSYEPINNKGILSGIGYAPSAQRESINNSHVSKIGFNVVESAIPSVKSPTDLRSSMDNHSGFVSEGLRGVISDIESSSSSPKYSQTLPGSRAGSNSAVPGISRMLSLIPEQRILPGSSSIDENSMTRSARRLDEIIGPSSIDTNSVIRSTLKPSDIVSGMTPSNPRPEPPSRITPERIISGITPSNPGHEPPSRITPERIISGMTPSNPTPDRGGGGSYSGFSSFFYSPTPTIIRRTDIISSDFGSGRSSSHVSITGSGFIPHYKPGGKKPDDSQKKIIEKSSIFGYKKHGILRNKFGDVDAFAKKALKGDQFKLKIKL